MMFNILKKFTRENIYKEYNKKVETPTKTEEERKKNEDNQNGFNCSVYV